MPFFALVLATFISFFLAGSSDAQMSTSGSASDPTFEVLRKVRGWAIVHFKDGDGACSAYGEYRSGTVVVLWKKGGGGEWMTQVSNPKWSSIKEGEEYDIDYVFDGRRSWSGGDVGIENGFQSDNIKKDFINDFARSSRLEIRFKDKAVDKFSLRGTRAAVNAVEECYRARVENTDPFASDDPFAEVGNGSDDPFATKAENSPHALFEQFSASSSDNAPSQLPQFEGRDKDFRSYRTRITDGLRLGPNFSGAHTAIEVGCGTACLMLFIVSNPSGQVFFLDTQYEYHQFLYRADSKLIVAKRIGEQSECKIDFIIWSNDSAKIVETHKIGEMGNCWDDISDDLENMPSVAKVKDSSDSFGGGMSFKTPSNNIHCLLEFDLENKNPWLRCDIMQLLSAIPPAPKNCEFDWGQAFFVTQEKINGERLCHSDTVFNESNPVLDYGSKWQKNGFFCISERTGLSCENRNGNGFFLSKRLQRTF